MKKILILVFVYFLFVKGCLALDIVYPKTNPVKINANSTFFIGSANPLNSLKINDIEVKPASSGAFAQIVPLNAGVNKFKITSGDDVINFMIERAQPQAAPLKCSNLIEYPILTFYVKNDNTPLRMTPVDFGINRISHLPKGTKLLINAEKGDFYRVYLNSQLSGWIAKKDVEQREDKKKGDGKTFIKEFKMREDKDFCFYEYDLNEIVPFVIKEANGLTLQIFNIYDLADTTYSINIPVSKLMGYCTYYKDNKFVLKIRKIPEINSEQPLKDIILAIDAGHGGTEFGAIGGCGDKEKDINLAISQNLKQELEQRGARVIMTREDDKNVSLQERVNLAKEKDAMFLISIHANALPDGQDPIKNRGTSIYYYHNQAKPLADSILNSMTTQLKTQNDKVRQGSLALVRPSASVSVLIEVGYIINPDDYELLLDKNFQQNCAKAIADGIEKYLTDKTFSN